MSNSIANTIYGADGGASGAPAAPAPAPAGRSPAAEGIYSDQSVPGGNPLLDGSVHGNLRSSLQDLVDSGQMEASMALSIGRTLTSEADAIGLRGGELDVAMRDLNRPIGDPKASQVERGEAVAALRSEYGDQAEQVMAAGLAVLRAKAPSLAAVLAQSRAGNNPALVAHIARLGERAMRSGGRR